jgi:hypothetical protein
MSLNRCEQMFFDHLSRRAEERQYWQAKVHSHLGVAGLNHYSLTALERELWAEFVEKSRVVKEFGAWLESGGGQRTSMRNLAEHLARLWLPPVVRKPATQNPKFKESS